MYYKYSKLFKQDSVKKQLIIEYDGGTITNEELYSESFELTESLCSESQLKFGSCEAGSVKFKICNINKPLKGKWLTISMIIGGKDDEPFLIGKYKVYSDAPSADRNYRDITAYDAMYDIINADITEFYNESIKNGGMPLGIIQNLLRDLGIGYKESVAETPNWYVASDSAAEILSGKDLINAFCELNGCFARIDRDGKFEFVKLGEINDSLYPGADVFPGTDVFPTTGKESSSSDHGFEGFYEITDGYIYSKVWGPKVIRDRDGVDTYLYGVGYKDVYDIRVKLPNDYSDRFCILHGSGFYVEKDGEKFFAPYFYWINENMQSKSSPDMEIEVDVECNGSFSMSGRLYCKTYEVGEDGGKYGIRNIPNIPVFEVYDFLRSYLNSGDLDGCINYSGFNNLEKSEYISCKYEDFTVKNIGCVLIRNSENDAGALAGIQGGNCYIIEDNFLVHGKGYDELKEIAENLYDAVKNVSYTPFSVELQGRPNITLGERVRIKTNGKNVESYILKRTLKGVQALRDSFSADGEEYYEKNINSVGKSIIQLKRKTNILERNLEETKSAIYDEETGLQSQITQNAELIDLKVSKGDVSSQISVESGGVAIKGNRLTVESDNFKLSGSGEMQATGKFITKSGTNEAVVDSGSIYFNINGSEVGTMCTADIDSSLGIAINSAKKFITLAKGTTSSANMYYLLNFGLNPNGVTKRHYFEDSIYSTKYLLAERLYCDELNGYIYGAGITDDDARLKTSGNFSVHGDLVVGGTKNRAVKTKNYGTVLMNAMESTGAYFTDIGSGKIADGVCYVYLDEKFIETIDTTHEYQVFLTRTSIENTDYVEKHEDYFIVYGENGATFDWMITAKQKDYQSIRMEVISDDEKEKSIEYDETLFDEDDISAVQSQSYMETFRDDIDESAIAYVESVAEMENEQFLL